MFYNNSPSQWRILLFFHLVLCHYSHLNQNSHNLHLIFFFDFQKNFFKLKSFFTLCRRRALLTVYWCSDSNKLVEQEGNFEVKMSWKKIYLLNIIFEIKLILEFLNALTFEPELLVWMLFKFFKENFFWKWKIFLRMEWNKCF